MAVPACARFDTNPNPRQSSRWRACAIATTSGGARRRHLRRAPGGDLRPARPQRQRQDHAVPHPLHADAAQRRAAPSSWATTRRTIPTRLRRQIGVVFQAQSIDVKLTAAENLRHVRAISTACAAAPLKARIAEMLGRVGLADRANDRAETFSGGMQRRLELAKGLLHHPSVLLLDEPTTGLDPGARRDLWQYLHILRDAGARHRDRDHAPDGRGRALRPPGDPERRQAGRAGNARGAEARDRRRRHPAGSRAIRNRWRGASRSATGSTPP